MYSFWWWLSTSLVLLGMLGILLSIFLEDIQTIVANVTRSCLLLCTGGILVDFVDGGVDYSWVLILSTFLLGMLLLADCLFIWKMSIRDVLLHKVIR
jgi:hypothetical protein